MRPVIGIDPGGRYTGIVVRAGEALHYACVVTRETDDMHRYVWEVYDALVKARVAGVQATLPRGNVALVAVEGINDPTGHMGMINVRGLIGTAIVLGSIFRQFEQVVVVPPEGNGSAPLPCYPAALVGPREKKGTGKFVHVRSAWDVAGKAEMYETLEKAVRRK